MNAYIGEHKPKMIDHYILHLIRAPLKPHYKTYLKMKINGLNWKTRKELTQYLIKNYRDNPDKYGYISSRYYHGVKYLVNYIFNNYSWNGNVQESKSKKQFCTDQIYFEITPVSFLTI